MESHEKIKIPNAICEQIIEFCNGSGLGFAEIAAPNFTVLIMGPAEMSSDNVSLYAAHLLLTGVLSGQMNSANEDGIGKLQKDASLN